MTSLWIGKYSSVLHNDLVQKYNYYDPAADNAQKNFTHSISFFSNNLDYFCILNFDKILKPLFVRTLIKKYDKGTIFNLGFLNLGKFSFLSKSIALSSAINNFNDKYEVTFVYGIQRTLLNFFVKIKKKNPNSKNILVVPDLPMYMNDKKRYITNFLKWVDFIILKQIIAMFDGYIIFSKSMMAHLPPKKFLLVEGIYDSIEIPSIKVYEPKLEIVFMYSGSLDSDIGILETIDAFMQLLNLNNRI
jgi:hypothetical protein